jgi:hypothetical protein
MTPSPKKEPATVGAGAGHAEHTIGNITGCGQKASAGAGQVETRGVREIFSAPENEIVYHRIDPRAAENIALTESVREHGVLDPIRISRDGFIVSGHRRYSAAVALGLGAVPVIVEDLLHADPQFMVRLIESYRQRHKSFDESAREQMAIAAAGNSITELQQFRVEQARISVPTLALGYEKHRARVSRAKAAFVDAIRGTLRDLGPFLPVSLRQVHYNLLNRPQFPAVAGRPYCNNRASYQALSGLLTQLRVSGAVNPACIIDETRPVNLWNTYASREPYLAAELDGFLRGYARDLLQSQPNHVEICAEKLTLLGTLKKVASDYCLPLNIMRGKNSVTKTHDIAERFKRSGKGHLVLLVLSDHDPDGMVIAESIGRTLRDDWGIAKVKPVKVAITPEQADGLKLTSAYDMEAKRGSSSYREFVRRYGKTVFELEAIPPAELQVILRQSIESVLDMDAFRREQAEESQEWRELQTFRGRLLEAATKIRTSSSFGREVSHE